MQIPHSTNTAHPVASAKNPLSSNLIPLAYLLLIKPLQSSSPFHSADLWPSAFFTPWYPSALVNTWILPAIENPRMEHLQKASARVAWTTSTTLKLFWSFSTCPSQRLPRVTEQTLHAVSTCCQHGSLLQVTPAWLRARGSSISSNWTPRGNSTEAESSYSEIQSQQWWQGTWSWPCETRE